MRATTGFQKKALPQITGDDHLSLLALFSPQVTEHCWIKLVEMEEQEAVFFGKGTCTVNNSCKGSLVY